jgi:hypothetical protein
MVAGSKFPSLQPWKMISGLSRLTLIVKASFTNEDCVSSQLRASRAIYREDSDNSTPTTKLSFLFVEAGAQQQSASFVQFPTVTVAEPKGITSS